MTDLPAVSPLPQPMPMTAGGSGSTLGRYPPEKLTATPDNPDTFTGLLARFDSYLAQLQKAESALEEHADKLVTVDPEGPALAAPTNVIGDDKSNSVIRRLQARIDRLSALTSALTRHQERADRAF